MIPKFLNDYPLYKLILEFENFFLVNIQKPKRFMFIYLRKLKK